MGMSPAVMAMKYEESLYIPEDLSFISIARSWGKVKMASNTENMPQNDE